MVVSALDLLLLIFQGQHSAIPSIYLCLEMEHQGSEIKVLLNGGKVVKSDGSCQGMSSFGTTPTTGSCPASPNHAAMAGSL